MVAINFQSRSHRVVALLFGFVIIIYSNALANTKLAPSFNPLLLEQARWSVNEFSFLTALQPLVCEEKQSWARKVF